MRLLLLGGTEFVGRAVVDEGLARGWEVTAFNRGRQEQAPGATALRGDRTAADGLSALATGEWDVVVDTWSGAPSAVRDAARLLAGRAGHYVYVSSRSVYAFPAPAGLGEDGPLVDGSPDDGEVEYAEAKRGGELAAIAAFGERALLARAGLILGPRENVGRLPWWLRRIERGGPVLAPGPRGLPLQYVDARDLAAWVLDAAGRGLGGAYNVVSPPGHATMGELLESCVRVTGSGAELRWTDPEPILAAGVEPWTDLPVWIPPGELYDALHQGDVGKAVGAGLRCRPVAETVADTWRWLRESDAPPPAPRHGRRPPGLEPEREAELLRRP
ncbi:NAD-dependent epimerase/dehydratase family protein [Streptacidiphilus sp. PB12-B1b]|uniref:NAD-dependent epimerase/dehydratase family protein n=1 Tax=Streptacidiphilus sp. PB12-B1b TaxID=2705012 RepID=UPI0015FD623B|nr:NAD-dependent epimerase/dehydratase family protein [Streptacidiphilus sp. PB12-B1b]QMU79375.1 NAD-dependent epimerase/dehydratase family protein [Streptacidiphilus sp. PB12-B1b]